MRKVINLAYPDRPGSLCKVLKFPDGQQNVVIDTMGFREHDKEVEIASRCNSFLDLELIACAVASLRRINRSVSITLNIPYLIGARSDRKFEEGGNSYLRDIVAPYLNSLHLDEVVVRDVHNPVAADCAINNLTMHDNYPLVNSVIEYLKEFISMKNFNRMVILSPDEGAGKKIHPLLQKIGWKGELVEASKTREIPSGKITGVKISPIFEGEDVLIIDDICDGGRTFIELAKEAKKRGAGDMYLCVTHGIFSAGFDELDKYFRRIFCSNSYSDITHGTVRQTKLI